MDEICVGDVVTTDYGTGPYTVIEIVHAKREPFGTHLRLTKDGSRDYWLNDIVLIDGTWFSLGGRDRLTIQPAAVRQPSLFQEATDGR